MRVDRYQLKERGLKKEKNKKTSVYVLLVTEVMEIQHKKACRGCCQEGLQKRRKETRIYIHYNNRNILARF